MSSEKRNLEQATSRFVDANNKADLDAAMNFFTDDVVFEDIYGGRHSGVTAIRNALQPFFDGTFGRVQYVGEDLFIDEQAGKVMVSWRCNLELGGKPAYLRGLDLLHFNNGKLVAKLAYGKASEALFEH